jgi:hypothetical protein
MVNQRSQNHATKINVYLIQIGQNGVIGLNVVKLVVEVPNLDQEPVKCQNQSEKPEISILKKTSHVQVHLQWFYSANWNIHPMDPKVPIVFLVGNLPIGRIKPL